MSDFGLSQGLAVRVPYSDYAAKEIQDQQYVEQQRRANEAMAMAKAKMLSDDFEMQNSTSPYDAPLVRQDFEQRFSNIANITKQNPNWHTDPRAMALISVEKQGAKTSPAVLRSVAYKEAREEYKKHLTEAMKNPAKYNMDDLKSFADKLNNYDKYGNEDGLEGLQRDGGEKPLVFTPPQELPDVESFYIKSGSQMEPDQMQNFNNGRTGAYTMKVSDDALRKKAEEYYLANKKAMDYMYKGKDPVQEIINGHKPYIKKDIFNGYERDNWKEKLDYENRLKSARAAQSQGVDPYIKVILESNDIAPTDEAAISSTFGSTPTVKYKGPDGKEVVESGNRFYWTRLSDKGGIKNGVKVGEGYFIKPMDWGEKQGILEDTKLWGTELAVKPEFRDAYEIWTPPPGKDGKSEPVLKVRGFTEVNANSQDYARKYNAYIHSTTKQREDVGTEESMLSMPVSRDEKGDLWTIDASGNYIPYNR